MNRNKKIESNRPLGQEDKKMRKVYCNGSGCRCTFCAVLQPWFKKRFRREASQEDGYWLEWVERFYNMSAFERMDNDTIDAFIEALKDYMEV